MLSWGEIVSENEGYCIDVSCIVDTPWEEFDLTAPFRHCP